MSQQFTPAPAAETKGAALTALIAGVVGLLLVVVYFTSPAGGTLLLVGAIVGLIGFIFSIVALRRRESKGMAITGLITGLVALLAAAAIYIFALIFIGALLA